jgi:CBS domain-containing protein/nitroimidazol reductase NimA-like FMN-containing flavoprotein (pyridoxamine 5'-phosphate oxidase superfamily)
MRASEFMTADVMTVSPDTTVKEAAAQLASRGITALPVVDEEGRLVGIVSEGDILRGRVPADPRRHVRDVSGEGGPLAHTVAEIMTPHPVALPVTADESDFAGLMVSRRIKSIPVVTPEGRVVGIVSRRDLLGSLTRDDESIRTDVLALLRLYTGDRVDWQVEVVDGAVSLAGPADEQQRHVGDLLARTVPGVTRVAPTRAGAGPEADVDRSGLRVLGFGECLARLRSMRVGRIAYVADGEVTILPINFGVDGTGIAFRTADGSKLSAAEQGIRVAFEVDSYETARRAGWSVLVRGVTEAVYEAAETARLDKLGVDPWADAVARPTWVRIRSDEITGRAILR